MSRCCWVGEDPLMIGYHDTEWGTPSHDDRHLYEMLVLEGAQAGLSWQTILRKRARYQEVFDGFDPARVARFTPARIEKLLADPGIVRNRGKLEAAVVNARKVLEVQDEAGSLDGFLWAFVGGGPIVNRWNSYRDAPALDRGLQGDEQGAGRARLQVRRPDHLLRLHAGHGHGGRSRSRLFPGRQGQDQAEVGAALRRRRAASGRGRPVRPKPPRPARSH